MLLLNLDQVASAPGGVARLRELILNLAVQGKLVPQDPADEPASVLLQKIRAEKDRLIAESKIKRDKPRVVVAEDKLPCDVPEGWVWARLSELGDFSGGKTPSTQRANFWDGHIPWITPKDMKQLRLSSSEDKVTQMAVDDGLALVPANSVLMVVRSGILRRAVPTAVNEVATTINQDLKALVLVRPELASYVQLLIRGFERFILQNLTKIGTTVESIQFDAFSAQRFPVPPLAEQSRIVTRVEELMRLCDALEAKGQLEATQHAQLASTLLGTLTNSATPEELADNWQRVAQHFDLLLDRPEAIDVLEQTLLQLAVRGLLVPQYSTDEPASVLLQRIRAEKDRLISEGKIKRDKPLPLIPDEEKPFELPIGWEWTRFGDVVALSSGVTLGRKTPIAKPVSLPYLRVANVQRWHLNLTSIKETVIDQSELPRFQLQEGDLLITEGGDWDKVGRTTIWRNEIATCLHQNHIFKARRLVSDWNAVWAELFLNSAVARSYFASSAKQTTNLASINMTQLKDCAFPVPPHAEQSRIVACVTALRCLCSDLRQRLTEAQATQSRLAHGLVDFSSSVGK